MDYKNKYKEALGFIEKVYKFSNDPDEKKHIEEIFPELKESENERIRKEIIDIIDSFEVAHLRVAGLPTRIPEYLAWLEKQEEQKPLYIRFGDIPDNEQSKIYNGENEIGIENGVSVYPAFINGNNVILGLTLPITKTTLYTQQHLLEYDNRPCYLVSGDYVGKGTDGEPLIKNISIIKKLDNYRIKEQKPAGKVKPKFGVGDIIRNKKYGFTGKIIAIDTEYRLSECCGTHLPFDWQDNYELVEQKPAELDENRSKELSLSLQIQAYLNTVSDYAKGKPLYSEEKLEDIHKCMLMWQKLHNAYFYQKPWSEEDEKMYNVVHDLAWESYKTNRRLDIPTFGIINDWFKSLKDRCTWKPSEEQMSVLRVLSLKCQSEKQFDIIGELIEQLKKLRE